MRQVGKVIQMEDGTLVAILDNTPNGAKWESKNMRDWCAHTIKLTSDTFAEGQTMASVQSDLLMREIFYNKIDDKTSLTHSEVTA